MTASSSTPCARQWLLVAACMAGVLMALFSIQALAVSYLVSSPTLSAFNAEESMQFTSPSLSAKAVGRSFTITSPQLAALSSGSSFELRAPALTADALGIRFVVSALVLSAITAPEQFTAPPLGFEQRPCLTLYQCWDKFVIRNAIAEVSLHYNTGEPGFCTHVKDWLGNAECTDPTFISALNNNFGFPHAEGTVACDPLDAHLQRLRARFDAGGDTQADEKALEEAYRKSFSLLATGQEKKFCEAIMSAISSG